ncbi:MAG: hypothetical protein ACI8PT_002210 [Gammaproteobacteria bacterium]|jgi:hypothetical protein
MHSTDPQAEIDFYTRQFPTSIGGTWGGFPALHSSNDTMILFDQVATAPGSFPQNAIWHFGWYGTDYRGTVATFASDLRRGYYCYIPGSWMVRRT